VVVWMEWLLYAHTVVARWRDEMIILRVLAIVVGVDVAEVAIVVVTAHLVPPPRPFMVSPPSSR